METGDRNMSINIGKNFLVVLVLFFAIWPFGEIEGQFFFSIKKDLNRTGQ